jgi:hypothetical protein
MELSITIAESARRGEPLAPHTDVLGPETAWERGEHDAFRAAYGVDPIKDLAVLVKNTDWLGVPQ